MTKFYPGDVVHYIPHGLSYKVIGTNEKSGELHLSRSEGRTLADPDKCYLLRRERDGIVACRGNSDEFGWVGRKEDETHPIIGVALAKNYKWEAAAELLAPPKVFKRGDVVRLKHTVTKEDLADFSIGVSVPSTPGIVIETTKRGNVMVAFEGLKSWYTYKPEWLEEVK